MSCLGDVLAPDVVSVGGAGGPDTRVDVIRIMVEPALATCDGSSL